jgi:hypothetical protein
MPRFLAEVAPRATGDLVGGPPLLELVLDVAPDHGIVQLRGLTAQPSARLGQTLGLLGTITPPSHVASRLTMNRAPVASHQSSDLGLGLAFLREPI